MAVYGNLVGGGVGFPQGWRDKRSLLCLEDIFKNDPILSEESLSIQALPSPSTLPTNSVTAVSMSHDEVYTVVSFGIGGLYVYKKDNDIFTKLDSPTDVPMGNIYAAAISKDGIYMAVGLDAGILSIYKRSGDTFTKLANPSTMPPSMVRSLAFSSDGLYLAVGTITSPYILIYKRSGDTFTKLANPSVLPTAFILSLAFSNDGLYLAVGHDNSPCLSIYKRSGDTFTKLANPSVLPGVVWTLAFSNDGTYLAVGSTGLSIYKRSGDTFTKLANPNELPSSSPNSLSFSSDGNYLSVGGGNATENSSYIMIYFCSEDTFAKIPSPETFLNGAIKSLQFSSSGNYLLTGHANYPYFTIYKNLETYVQAQKLTPSRLLSIGTYNNAQIGIALESKNEGEYCKVNLFPAIDTTPPEPEYNRYTDNLTSWYSGLDGLHSDTQWFDQSGNNNDGSLANIMWGQNYAQFNGISSRVDCGVQNSPQVTFDVYVEWTAVTTVQEVVISNLSNATPFTGAFIRKRASDGIDMGVAIGGTAYYANDPSTPVAGVKYHYVGRFNGSQITLHKNGVLIATTNQSGSIANSVRMTLGARNSDTNFANLKIYDAARYNIAIPDTAIAQNRQFCIHKYGE